MVKRRIIKVVLFLLVLLLFSNFVLANTYLFENSTWSNELTGAQWASVALGDIDNDGDLDLAQIGCTGTSGSACNGYLSRIYINNGINLTENSTWEQNLTAVHYGSIAWGDIDNDGDLDLALTGCNNGGGSVSNCNSGGENSFIYTNNGTSLIENSTWKGDITNVWKGSISFGDIDLDGDLDLALTGNGPSSKISKIYINNGTGFAENSTWQNGITAVHESAITLDDLDNDGKLDLVLTGDAGTSDERTEVYINNGSSLVGNATWEQNLLDVDLSAISLGDFDNNGNIDLTLIGHTSSDHHRIYNNTGTTFEQLQKELGDLIGIFEGSQSLGDYDNDGDLDLISSGEEQYTTLYLFNSSANNFTDNTQDPESDIFNTAFGPSLVWGDLDNDNDLDLILTSYDFDRLKFNASVYINNITTANTVPTAPTNFTASYQNGQLTLTWDNATDTETPTLGLYYNLKVSTTSGGHDIVSGVYGGGDDNGYFGNMMQRKSITLNVNLNVNQTIFYSVQTIDTALANGSWSVQQSFTVPIDTTTPTITLNAPIDSFNTSNFTIIFNATVSDDINLTNVTLYGNWTGSLSKNETNSSGINNSDYLFTKDLTSFGDGAYTWLIEGRDNSNNTINSSLRTFRIDTTYPQINISSPANASTWTSSQTVTFTYNVTDADIANCSLIIDNVVDQTDTSITVNTDQTFTKELSNADYNWSINCTDYMGLQNNSKTYDLTVSYTAPASPSGGGGGGSGGGSTAAPKYDADFSKVTKSTLTASEGESLTISLDGVTEHTITVDKVDVSSATITIRSHAITLTLNVGEIKNVDIDHDNVNDLRITLDKIEGKSVTLDVTTLILESKGVTLFSLDKKEVRATVMQGETVKETLKITNDGDTKLDFTLSVEGLKILLSDEGFSLLSGESKTVEIHFVASAEEEVEAKTGKLILKYGLLKKEIPLVMEVKKREALFDVKVSIPEKFKKVYAGDDVTAEITLTNLGKVGKVDVILDYFVVDLEGKVIASAMDTLAVETVTSFIRTLSLPEVLTAGDYNFLANVTYKETVTVGKAEFKVIKEYPLLPAFLQKNLTVVVIGFVLLLVIIVVLYFILKEEKLEKEVKKLKRRKKN